MYMIPSTKGWPTKAKEAPSPHEVRLTPTGSAGHNPVICCLGGGGGLAIKTFSK